VLAGSIEMLEFAFLLRGWSGDVVGLTEGKFIVPAELKSKLTHAGIRLDQRPITRLTARDQHLESVQFADGATIPLDVIFARPPQRQVPVVQSLGLTLDSAGYVQVDDARRETSRPGIYAAGDLVTPVQGAILAAAAGMRAAGSVNHALMMELGTTGAPL
jgi:thioredoxin reductase